jgi:hypothetical protein
MPFKFKSFPRKKRRMSCPESSGDQPPARNYHLGITVIWLADRFCPGVTTVVSDPAWQIDTHDDTAMNAIQTSLAILQAGSSLASKLPFIAPIAGLLLQALTMRDARIPYIPSDTPLMIASPGSKTIQRGVQNSCAQTRQNREDRCQFVRKV